MPEQEDKSIPSFLKIPAGIIAAVVTLWGGMEFIDARVTKRIREEAKIQIQEEIQIQKKEIKDHFKEQAKKDPVVLLLESAAFVDKIKKDYPKIQTLIKDKEFIISGLYVNPETKERYFVNTNGLNYKVFYSEEDKGLYYFSNKLIRIQ